MSRLRLPGVPGIVRRPVSAVRGLLGDVDIAGLAASVDQRVNAAFVAAKRHRQSLRPTVVVPYMGWYADGVVRMTARCIEKPLFNTGGDHVGVGQVFLANLRRFIVLTMPGVTVRASLGQVSGEFSSDSDGYLHIELPTGPLRPGWHAIEIRAVTTGTSEPATGRILVPDPDGGVAIISDIDDTILKTGLTQRWTAAGRTFLRDFSDRKPVKGMSTLFAGLVRGTSPTGPPVPCYYVSTGSWNYYDYLVAFMDLHHFPRGPLFLTDWGPTAQRLMRDGREHKRSTIRALVTGHPGYSFVLVGDIGQGDPETYEIIAREFPDQIRAGFLISVGSHLPERTAAVVSRTARLREEGVPLYYVANAVEAVTVAWQLGLVDRATTAAISAEFGSH